MGARNETKSNKTKRNQPIYEPIRFDIQTTQKD